MTDGPKISVIVPAYNNGPWLPRCLDSILVQTYQNLEVIVVNDGSEDNTAAVMETYAQKDTRIRAIHQENGGVTSARLAGLKIATGVWIGFVDGDDAIDPDMYEHLLRNALEYQAEISHCGYRMVFTDGRVNYFHNSGRLLQHDRDTALKELLSGTMIEPGLCNKLFRAELFEKMLASPALDTGIRINEDLLMNFILFSYTRKTVFEDFCPYQYIVRQGSASREPLNHHRIYDPIRVKERIVIISNNEILPLSQKAYLQTCISVYNCIILADAKKQQKNLRRVREYLKEHIGWRNYLGAKQRILLCMILNTPGIHRFLYKMYYNFFIKNPYE